MTVPRNWWKTNMFTMGEFLVFITDPDKEIDDLCARLKRHYSRIRILFINKSLGLFREQW